MAALAAHRDGDLARAEALYRQSLAENPADVESLHMLGVVSFERLRHREALALLVEACERTDWHDPVFRQNLGLVLAKLLGPRANAEQEAIVDAYLARERTRRSSLALAPRVSVIVVAHENPVLAARSVASADAQTWADRERIVVPSAIDAVNAAARNARGTWLAFLGPGDLFAPDRVAGMVAAIARPESLWGFSWVGAAGDESDCGDADIRVRSGEAESGRPPAADPSKRAPRPGDFLGNEPASFGFLQRDIAGADGNLFIERDLFLALGGYRSVDRWGWDFAVRAARRVEPVVVERRHYLVGGHDQLPGSRPANPDPPAVRRRADELLIEAIAGDPEATNTLCPQHPANRELVLRDALRAGRGDRIPASLLRSIAAELTGHASGRIPCSVAEASAANSTVAGDATVTPNAAAADGVAASDAAAGVDGVRATDGAQAVADRVALVVLGVYRSGTSAVARVLNLCGASLPQRLIAPRLALNPTGFWEAEAITDLDIRFLHRLGADWNTLDVSLPERGPLVDEFLATSKEVLAREYGDARAILIKDPRICMLAPLWHRTLSGAGYRPAYLVVVRHPVEVARSFERQGDVRVNGLAVWQAYLRRAEGFVEGVDARVVHVRYADLLVDWRGVVGRIARKLDVDLDANRRAAEVDRFLVPDLRSHTVDESRQDMDLDGLSRNGVLTGAQLRAVHTLYRHLLDRCDRDVQFA